MKHSLVLTEEGRRPCGVFHPREGKAIRYQDWRKALSTYSIVVGMVDDGDDDWPYSKVDKFLVPGELL